MISNRHKYIFVHIPKCGGTSIEKALLTIENVDLNIGRGGNNTTGGFGLNRLSKEYQIEYKVGINGRQHLFLDKFPPRCQEEYFCFTFVRNPWDLLVSKYYYSRQPQKGVSFREMIFLMDDAKMRPRHRLKHKQTDFINSNINYIGRFENLEADFKKICDILGLNPPKLEHLNTTHSERSALGCKDRPYWEYYDEETKEIVATKYKKDIETFGYKFGHQ